MRQHEHPMRKSHTRFGLSEELLVGSIFAVLSPVAVLTFPLHSDPTAPLYDYTDTVQIANLSVWTRQACLSRFPIYRY
jgi:hypothetical protein